MPNKSHLSKTMFERELSAKGIPENEKKSKGGRVTDTAKNYGLWLRFNDRKRFEKLYNEWVMGKQAEELRASGYNVSKGEFQDATGKA